MTTTATTDAKPHTGTAEATRLIIAASLGNALEFYEILVYGYFAVVIAKVFFPAADEAVSLLVTFGTFGASFLARPVGAIFLGAYGDRKGRKNALTLSILLMTIGTGLMTVMPSYATLGLLSPALVIAARLLQGFSVGGEFASSTAFLVEHRPDRAGFFASWQWSSQGLAALIATGFGVFLTNTMSAADLQAWGWRIPFAFGLLIGPVGYYVRSRMAETPEFVEAGAASAPMRDLLVNQWDRLLLATGAVVASTSAQYMIVYMPTYAIRELHLSQSVGFTAAVLAAALQTLVVPFVGIWVDKVGQTPVMIGAAVLFAVTAYPAFALLGANISLAVLVAMVCWLSLLKSFYSGALPSLLARVFPTSTRVSGMSLSYNAGVAIFGGFAPFFAQSLIDLTGSKLAPSYYMIGTALLSLAAIVTIVNGIGSDMEILIVGGGIGGLTLALSVHASHPNARIKVFEAAPDIRALGVGINIGPHAVKELSALGLEDALVAIACLPQDYAFFTRQGQLVYREPWGKAAGHQWPHISIHRGELHQVLLDAVRERIGPDNFIAGYRCVAVEQDDVSVTARFTDPDGKNLPPQRGDVLIACDGIHSAVRAQFYPDEGSFCFRGTNLWRGVTRRPPYLTGRSIARIGARHATMIIYPIRNNIDAAGNQLINWVAEIEQSVAVPVDWSKPGRLEDFYPTYRNWTFDWLDAAALIRDADFNLSYPMVDRDPLSRWTFGRVTLLGDAAHPMYPQGGNGGAQAIIDAGTLGRLLGSEPDPVAALQAYEASRLPATSKIVLQNRSAPPNVLVDAVEQKIGDRKFEKLEDVISQDELRAIFERYQKVAGYHVDQVGRKTA